MTRDILLNDILSDGAGESSVHGGMVSRVSFMACRHLSRFMTLLECDCFSCMCT